MELNNATGECMCPGNKSTTAKGICPEGEECRAHLIKGKHLSLVFALFPPNDCCKIYSCNVTHEIP
jgi:hypothetical protein